MARLFLCILNHIAGTPVQIDVMAGPRMLAISILFLAALAMMAFAPETSAARSLRRWLIEAPARRLNRINAWRTLFYAGLAGTGLVVVVLFEAEGAILYGAMAPEILTRAVLFEVGLMIDAIVIGTAVLASNGPRILRAQVRGAAGRLITAMRRPRRASATAKPGRASDDDRPAWGLQAAYRAFSMA